MNQSERLLTLDAMRGIAAILVVLLHLPVTIPYSPKTGFVAVDFFLMLSGFVLARAYGADLNGRMSVSEFAIKRLIRLYPLYAVGMLLGLVVRLWQWSAAMPSALTGLQIAQSLAIESMLLPSKVTTSLFSLNGPAWSLFFELVVNLLYAGALVRLRLRLLFVVAAVAGSVLALMGHNAHNFNLGFNWHTLPFGLVRTLFAFTVGVIIARTHTSAVRVSAWALLLPLALAVFLASRPSQLSGIYTLCTMVLAAPALVWWGASVNPPARWVAASRILGDLSYPVYAIHAPLVLLFFWTARLFNIPKSLWLTAFFATLFALAFALNLVDIRVRTTLSVLARRIRLQAAPSDASKPERSQF